MSYAYIFMLFTYKQEFVQTKLHKKKSARASQRERDQQ